MNDSGKPGGDVLKDYSIAFIAKQLNPFCTHLHLLLYRYQKSIAWNDLRTACTARKGAVYDHEGP